ncbi:hypothetical protein LZ32DRAFT_599758 [Colletotrichum eremochloae]|nr:hypothetical protein LZ32DRAFT_599758 [Colletotrichum eremochloae]
MQPGDFELAIDRTPPWNRGQETDTATRTLRHVVGHPCTAVPVQLGPTSRSTLRWNRVAAVPLGGGSVVVKSISTSPAQPADDASRLGLLLGEAFASSVGLGRRLSKHRCWWTPVILSISDGIVPHSPAMEVEVFNTEAVYQAHSTSEEFGALHSVGRLLNFPGKMLVTGKLSWARCPSAGQTSLGLVI